MNYRDKLQADLEDLEGWAFGLKGWTPGVGWRMVARRDTQAAIMRKYQRDGDQWLAAKIVRRRDLELRLEKIDGQS